MGYIHTCNVGQRTSHGLIRHYVEETTANGDSILVAYFFDREQAKAFANAMNATESTKRDGSKYVAHTDHPKH